MLARLSKWLIVLVLTLSLGLHWSLLQSVAWIGMIVNYSQGGATLSEALVKTFDGKHPCCLCKQIAKGKQSEKKSDLQIEGKKLEFLDARISFVFSAPNHFRLLPVRDDSFSTLTHAPPVPPPKQLPG